jgi:hypothetical protein
MTNEMVGIICSGIFLEAYQFCDADFDAFEVIIYFEN